MKGSKDLKNYAFAIAEAYKSNEIWFIKLIKDWHWLIACFVGAIYIMIAYLKGGFQNVWHLAILSLPLPLGLIWLGDAAGKIKGSIWLRPAIFRTSPGFIVKLLGWTILLLQLLRLLYHP